MTTLIATATTALGSETKDGAWSQAVELKENPIYTIDDLLVSRCQKIPTLPLVAYPGSSRGRSDYIHYTAKDLDRFAFEAAKRLTSLGLSRRSQFQHENEVVAILAPSNIDYVTSIFALSRLGFAVLLLSNRLATEAYVNLLRKTNCNRIIHSENHTKAIAAIQKETELTCYPLLDSSVYDLKTPSGPRSPYISRGASASSCIAFIIHSSGSTGLPKPIFQTHKACLMNYSSSFGFRAFLTLPLYHNHGLSSFFRAIHSGKEISLFNASLPLSGSNLIEAMEAVNPESFHGVPYALKLLAETERGIQVLRDCKLVLFGGSSCPDDLGDRLTEAGVYIVGHYGATEMGQLMTSFRAPEDKAWNYMRPLPSAIEYIKMVPRAPNTFECVVLDGLPSKVVSNSDDPPNSFNTSDLFSPHPQLENAWKYLGRLDDRVTLVNGEKVLPIPYEHQVREHELVREACVFGVGRALPGLIIVPSEKASGMSKESLLQQLWPVIQAANARVEAFSQISQEMIAILDVGTEYPCTDKGTMIRAAFYRKFEDLINAVYNLFEAPIQPEGALQLDIAQLEAYLSEVFTVKIGIESKLTSSTDFFEAGIDSLQAITARGMMMRELDLGGNILGQNVVFEYPNIGSLASHLYCLRTGDEAVQRDEIDIMRELIKKYSHFSEHIPGPDIAEEETIILTGATGSLGAHILRQLLDLKRVKSIYCLVRATSPNAAKERVLQTLSAKKIDESSDLQKIICLPSDLSREDLGLDAENVQVLRSSLTTVIHSAWAVNFNLGVQSFEQHHIKGTFNLLNICLNVTTKLPAKLFFCSSESASAGTPLPATIHETYIDNLEHAQSMGYARSKLVTENIIKAAGEQTDIHAQVLRVGQIVGDTRHGIWNNTEAIPLMIQSATTIHALPALEETPSWMPVDLVARSVLELSGLADEACLEHTSPPYTVYHVKNSNLFHWTRDLLPALKDSGLEFDIVTQREWVQRLRDSEKDPEKNPTIKLVDFFANKYDNDKPGRKGLVLLTEKTGEKSKAILDGYDVVGNGLVGRFVASWKGNGW
ncbi:NRPS-like enzyme (male sterility protein) [Phlyctema vagabunda]|uniref:NRPS-like enzyme (Male sterility protein) n=1 Tax=Phlyctema vagabunda TaxID=108571 RepID=A0ABR4PPP1_9HELO